MSSPSLKTSSLLFGPLSSSSLKSSSSHSSPAKIQKLCSTAQATIILDTAAIFLSSIASRILHWLFKIPKAHSTTTRAEDNSLLNRISPESLVPSGYGFCSHGESGSHQLLLGTLVLRLECPHFQLFDKYCYFGEL